MANSKDNAGVATYGDHEIITPENKLRRAVNTKPPPPGDDDPVARAEKALSELSGEFASWMESECQRLDKARDAITTGGFTGANKEALFHAAHDIKGEAATFGFPLVALAADSLPLKLVDQHVDAVRAIYREYARSDAKELASILTKRLRAVTDEFLIHENRGRPDVLEQIMGPSIVPG
jgi:HPt (histidine-containing phosphotransfer) domain-containing protein